MCKFKIKSQASFIALFLMLHGCGSAALPTENRKKDSQVTVTTIESGTAFTQKSYLGYVRAYERGELSFEIGGKVVFLHLDIGDTFQEGDILSKVDAITSELALKEVMASLDQAKYDFENAKIEYNRRRILNQKLLVSETEVDLWRLRLDSARAEVSVLQAKRDIAKKALFETQIIAPFDGTVTGKFVQKNQHVSPNQSILSVKSTDTKLEVLTRIPYQHINRKLTKEPVFMHTLEKKPLAGVITSVNRQASSNGLIEVLIVLDELYLDAVVPGAPVNVLFNVGNNSENFSVPISALHRDTDNNHFVWLLNPDTLTVTKHIVTIQRIRSGKALISGDLLPGSEIVKFGGKKLTNGQRVELVKS